MSQGKKNALIRVGSVWFAGMGGWRLKDAWKGEVEYNRGWRKDGSIPEDGNGWKKKEERRKGEKK